MQRPSLCNVLQLLVLTIDLFFMPVLDLAAREEC